MECGANLVGEHGRTLTGYSRQWAGGQFDDFVISQKGLRIYLNECMVRSSKEKNIWPSQISSTKNVLAI